MTYHDDPNLTCTHEELVQVMQVTVVVPHGTQTINKRVMRDPATRIGSSVEDHTRCAKCGLVIARTDNMVYVDAVYGTLLAHRHIPTKIQRIKVTRDLCDSGLRLSKQIVEMMYTDDGHGEPKPALAHITIGQIKKEWNL